MIYPQNFEYKIGFKEVRELLKENCLSSLGRELVEKMSITHQASLINEWFEQIREFKKIQEEEEDFPLEYFFDVRSSVSKLRLEGTHLEINDLFDLRRSLDTIGKIVRFLAKGHEKEDNQGNLSIVYSYPTLQKLSKKVSTFPNIVTSIDRILDKYGRIKDNASPELLKIRQELSKTEGSISRTLHSILRNAQSDGLVDKDVAPTMRDGRLVIPIAPGLKRKISGIVHDESATGKTVFVEPTEVVEANNRIRELESEERREIIRILSEISNTIRPHIQEIVYSYNFLAIIDFIRAKCQFAKKTKGTEPKVTSAPHIDWIDAIHPLLQLSLSKQNKKVIPLNITLTKERRILLISGPNAGGKSVCLKTVGLLQYMLQCGLPIPVADHSKTGVFKNIMIDIGDEQSIENDLSTYSSHLMNMKQMIKFSDEQTLLLIDEFGTGTEPQIGGAIAEAVLNQFCKKKAYGVITTHYQNLKHFADSHDGVINGAMLYDRHEMQPLFQLSIGQPGSSFAIEIARKTGLPEDVIKEASEIVGSEYIQSDKYLQDIVRDKRYWENKRQTIRQREKDMEKTISKYETNLEELEKGRKDILKRAKEQAEEILKEGNRRIENAIREIKEKQAEKESTKKIRDELKLWNDEQLAKAAAEKEEKIAKKIAQIQQRKERHEKHKREKADKEKNAAESIRNAIKKADANKPLKVGDTVKLKGTTSIGTIESISGKNTIVIFGDIRSKMKTELLERAKSEEKSTMEKRKADAMRVSRMTRDTIDNRRKDFKQDLDVRGMRTDEALNTVQGFIDDAILVGIARVRILHGKGNGILRQMIRQYLKTIPNVVHFADEHVQFGGAGITVVEIG